MLCGLSKVSIQFFFDALSPSRLLLYIFCLLNNKSKTTVFNQDHFQNRSCLGKLKAAP